MDFGQTAVDDTMNGSADHGHSYTSTPSPMSMSVTSSQGDSNSFKSPRTDVFLTKPRGFFADQFEVRYYYRLAELAIDELMHQESEQL
jgi:hypothetical protein